MTRRQTGSRIMVVCRAHVNFAAQFIFEDERLTGNISALPEAKFGTCCWNSQLTSHFLLFHDFPGCIRVFQIEIGLS